MAATMKINKVLALAEKHVGAGHMASSAKLCLEDARSLAAKGQPILARVRAMRSLQYSIGMFHPDYIAADLPSLPDTQGYID